MIRSSFRETGSSDSSRPAPVGEFDGGRRRALEALLAQYERLEGALERESAAHAFWSKGQRLRRLLKLALVVFAANIIWGTGVEACTLSARQADVSATNCTPLDPAAAAAVLKPFAFAPCVDCDGPHVVIVNSQPGALSWLEFPASHPARRLDGTLLSDPLSVYGGFYDASICFLCSGAARLHPDRVRVFPPVGVNARSVATRRDVGRLHRIPGHDVAPHAPRNVRVDRH